MSIPKHNEIIAKIQQLLTKDELTVAQGLTAICEVLQKKLKNYDWVGFYFSDFKDQMLYLKAFAGAPTDHTSIPFGKGICGQVALSNNNFLVPEVTAEDNYIACSLDVRSELVVPLFFKGKNIGQIDVDSKIPDRFSNKDVNLLRNICNLVSSSYGNLLYQL